MNGLRVMGLCLVLALAMACGSSSSGSVDASSSADGGDGSDAGATVVDAAAIDAATIADAALIDAAPIADAALIDAEVCDSPDVTDPVASNHSPAGETRGVVGTTEIVVELFDACGVDTGSVTMGLGITPPVGPPSVIAVPVVVTGSGSNVTVTGTPVAPLVPGSIVVVNLSADDIDGNTLTETWRFSVRRTITLVSTSPGGSMVNQLDETIPTTVFLTAGSDPVGGAAPDRKRLLIRLGGASLPLGALIVDASLSLARCPGAFTATTIECYGMRAGSSAFNSTWAERIHGPPGPSILWTVAGADGVPGDRAGTVGGSVVLPVTAQDFVWEIGSAVTVATEWAAGDGSPALGILCMNTIAAPTELCGPFSNGPPQMQITFGPPLP